MSKNILYQTDFKPDYELFQQKISQLSSQKSRIPKKQVILEKLQHQLELIKEEIEDQGFEYDQSPIFLKFATVQEINAKKKTASDCCMHCGEEMKKSVQCQICAQVYCKNCCWRKRVIPYAEHQDFRLSCEECHQKYIKHFNNQQFYKEKAVYLAAIDQLERKYEKTKGKYDKKQAQVNQYKQQKRQAKIKQGNLKKAVLDEQKRIKQLSEDFEKAVKQKAMRLKQDQEQKKKQQEEERQIKLKQQEEKQKTEQMTLSQVQQDQRKLQQAARLREQELAKRQEQIRRQKEQLQRQKKQLSESRLRQLAELQKKKSQTKIDGIQSPVKSIESPVKSIYAEKIVESPSKPEPPRQVVSMEQIDFDSILKNEEQSQAKQTIKDQKAFAVDPVQSKPEDSQQPNLKQLLKEIKLNKKVQEKPQKQSIKEDNLSKQKEKSQNQEQLELNPAPRLTMTQIKTMSINDLLSMKIPMNPSASKDRRTRKSSHPEIKVDAQQNSTTTQNQKMYQSLLEPAIPQQAFMVGLAIPSDFGRSNQQKTEQLRKSMHSVHQEEDDGIDKENSKKALLRRQSLISSVNKSSMANQKTPQYNEDQTGQGQAQKCTCQIM